VARQGASYRFELAAWRRGLVRVVGVDEAGRGPLAGPVVAAAVILAPGRRIAGLDDSKLLAPAERERLFEVIARKALAVGVGEADPVTIDRANILVATRLAMQRALAALAVQPELVLTDFVDLAGLECPQRNLVHGDQRSASVAAASIVAKVTRDRLMDALGRQYPQYGFGQHKGYATPAHREAIWHHGPCPLHRRSFAGVSVQGELFPVDPAAPEAGGPGGPAFDLVLVEE
jgi:ribonuclease HII